MNLSTIPAIRLPLLHDVALHGLRYKHTDLDQSLIAVKHLGVTVPAQRIEEDSVHILVNLRALLSKSKVLPMQLTQLPSINRATHNHVVQEMLESVQKHRRELLLKALQQSLVHGDHANVAYTVLRDFDVEHSETFLLQSLHTAIQDGFSIKNGRVQSCTIATIY